MLTAEQVAYFDLFGYLLLRGEFVHEIEEISCAFDEVFEDPRQLRLDSENSPYVSGLREVVPAVIELHPTLKKLKTDSRILDIADSLLPGGHVFLKGDGSRFHSASTTWHVDAFTNPKYKTPHIKMALYLEPLDKDSGALRVIPGSHHDGDQFVSKLRDAITSEGIPPSVSIGVDGADIPCSILATVPGDLIVWNRRIAHATYRSQRSRRVISFGFRGARSS